MNASRGIKIAMLASGMVTRNSAVLPTAAHTPSSPARTATIAVDAASRDPRVRALMLISPDAAPTDRGIVRTKLARLGRPVFFQVPSFDVATMPFVQALYESTNQRVSRISDSELAGYGAQSFHYDASALPRLTRWLNESWTTPSRTAPRRQ